MYHFCIGENKINQTLPDLVNSVYIDHCVHHLYSKILNFLPFIIKALLFNILLAILLNSVCLNVVVIDI